MNVSDTMCIAFGGEASRASRPRLLVVDDQPVNVQVLYRIFQEDHEILMATSGKQAIRNCIEQSPDLVLLDVMLPDMDGFEVCRQLKEHPVTRRIPVIFVTSQYSAEEETRGLEVGAVDFITKPVNPAVVKARVQAHLTLKVQSDALRALAFADGLTGLPNRRQFDRQLDTEWKAANRDGSTLAVIMIDVDHFKLYNDRYGHLEGDDCLKSVAAAIQGGMRRPRDFVARYGGEEFACLLPGCPAEAAQARAEDVLREVAGLAIRHEASETADVVTVSAGFAVAVPNVGGSPTALVSIADEQLYRAKTSSRNTVVGHFVEFPLTMAKLRATS